MTPLLLLKMENGNGNRFVFKRTPFEWSRSLYTWSLNTKNGRKILLNGWDKLIIPNYSHILTIKALYFNLKKQYTPISLKVKHSFHLTQSITYTSTEATQLQKIIINSVLAFGLMAVELASGVSNEEILLLIEYRVP